MCTQTAQFLLHTEIFTRSRRNFTQSKFYTQFIFRTETFTHGSLYAQQFLHTDGFYTFFPHRSRTHKNLHTTIFAHRRFCTRMPLHRQTLTHTHTHCQYTHTHKLCTQHAFTHNQLLHREALFPLLDHYLTCSRSQVMLIVIYIDVKKKSPFLRYCASQSGHEKVLFPLLERTWELRVPTEKPKRLGKWLGMAGPCKDRRRYDEPHI